MASVFVSDADRAYDFYVRRLGFAVLDDQPLNDGDRRLEIAPPGAETRLAVVKPAPSSPGTALGGITRIVFSTDDIQSAYEELSTRGVSFSEKPARQIWGAVEAHFADPDGNIFLLVEGDD